MNRDIRLRSAQFRHHPPHRCGKTTTSERVLFYTGAQHKIGEVHEAKRPLTGWNRSASAASRSPLPLSPASGPVARARQENTAKENAFQRHRHARTHRLYGRVKRSMRVLDGAVVVFDGVAGVEPQSETNWRYADEANVPRLCFINKLDRTGASFERSYASILDRLSKQAVRMQILSAKRPA